MNLIYWNSFSVFRWLAFGELRALMQATAVAVVRRNFCVRILYARARSSKLKLEILAEEIEREMLERSIRVSIESHNNK